MSLKFALQSFLTPTRYPPTCVRKKSIRTQILGLKSQIRPPEAAAVQAFAGDAAAVQAFAGETAANLSTRSENGKYWKFLS